MANGSRHDTLGKRAVGVLLPGSGGELHSGEAGRLQLSNCSFPFNVRKLCPGETELTRLLFNASLGMTRNYHLYDRAVRAGATFTRHRQTVLFRLGTHHLVHTGSG
jgi:hypothetical protein